MAMSGSTSPSSRWNREHGYWKGSPRARIAAGGKKIYRSWWRARINAWRLNRKYGDNLHVYACQWGDNYRDGETAAAHWHLGHPTPNDWWGY